MKKLALLSVLVLVPFFVHAAVLININTADEAALESLPGIGPTKASAIIAYRDEYGPFATIADIENVSGIGTATFGAIESLISVSDSDTEAVSTDAATSTSDSASSSAASATTAQVTLTPVQIDDGGDRVVSTGADAGYTASVLVGGSAADDPQVRWTFGDGSTALGASVMKSYALPGTYVVSVGVVADSISANDSFTVVAKAPQIKVAAISSAGIAIENQDTTNPLDLSLWQLSSGSILFTFPEGTEIAAGATITFSPAITGLPLESDATLLYPSGAVAATYAPTPMVQPAPVLPSSNQVQVESASTSNDTAHAAEPISAPATTSELAAAGAAMPASTAAFFSRPHLISMIKSPWTLGGLAVLVFSGAALMVL